MTSVFRSEASQATRANICLFVCKAYSETPRNIIINKNTSVMYEILDEERVRQTVIMGGIQYAEELYYAGFTQGERVDIPCPRYVGTYKDSIIFMRGAGASYRDVIVYQKKQNAIVKKDYENYISMTYYPADFEKYVFVYDSSPVIIKHFGDRLCFFEVEATVEKEISEIEIFSDEIIIHFNDKEKLVIHDESVLEAAK